MIRTVILTLILALANTAAIATENPQVLMKTTHGDITLELYPEAAPVTVANFLQYVNDGFYDGTLFHRVVPGFVVQGGGFTFDFVRKSTRDPIVNESNNGLKNRRGTVAMARLPAPDSATAQFYINLVDNWNLDAETGGEANGYAVFAKVISGMKVADAMAKETANSEANGGERPFLQIISTKQISQK